MIRIGALVLIAAVGAAAVRRFGLASASIATDEEQFAEPLSSTPVGFSGEPSIIAKAIVAALRIVGAITDLSSRMSSPAFDLDPSSPRRDVHPPFFATIGLRVQHKEFRGWRVIVIAPSDPSGKNVIALHGGAYVSEPTLLHWLDYASIARDTSATVVVPMYPLAPTGTADSVVPLMADLISHHMDTHGAENVSVYGDSAGGGLALAAVQELVQRNDPRPSHMVLLSPWLDVTMSNPAIAMVDDPVLSASQLATNGLLWAGRSDPSDPIVSPLNGSLQGLPPVATYSGSLDVLAPDVLVLADKALTTPDAKFSFVLREGEIHNWAMGGLPLLPEAAAVRPNIYRQLGLASGAAKPPHLSRWINRFTRHIPPAWLPNRGDKASMGG